MNQSQEKALYHLTGQTYHNAVTLEAVQKIAETYPYFAPAQCLLAYQFKQEEHPMVVLQTLKTALYFTNPYWLQYQLQEDGLPRPKLRVTPVEMIPPVQTKAVEPEEPITEQLIAVIQEEPVPEPPIEATTEEITEPEQMLTNIQIAEEELALPEPEPIEPVHAEVIPFSTNMAIPTIEAVKEMMRSIDHPPSVAETEANETLPAPEEIPAASPEEQESENKIASLLSNQLADFKKPVEADAKLDIETTPEKLYTVDYFASQGIKIDLTTIPHDKLATQVLKFTDWLKQMKQGDLNAKDLVASIEMEQAVVQTAQHSNEKEEIITEAMAEVLEKQGQLEKAIEVYTKLSFLNPEKSSYFAAKIEHLKGV